jgi:predicted ribosome quality control (RQC) complex YloA/Tae2 family protein
MTGRRSERRPPPPPPDPEAGLWRGRSVARRFTSPDGLTVLVGRTAADNDVLSLHLGAPRDFWLHVAGDSGSHVVVRNPAGLDRLPRDSERFAAGLAARYSKARRGGRVAVHLTTCSEVSKPRGLPPGQVQLGRYRTLHATPAAEPEAEPVKPDAEAEGSEVRSDRY